MKIFTTIIGVIMAICGISCICQTKDIPAIRYETLVLENKGAATKYLEVNET